jgi:hypothetical protein
MTESLFAYGENRAISPESLTPKRTRTTLSALFAAGWS